MLIISPDAYVRLPFEHINSIRLVHLISGLDEDSPPIAMSDAALPAITGYTEWVSEDSVPITIGWDWQLCADGAGIRVQRVSEPRSNVMLQDMSLSDLGPVKTAALLETFVDNNRWQDAVLAFIHGVRQ